MSSPCQLGHPSRGSPGCAEYGVALAEHRDPPQGALLRRWLDVSVMAVFERRILDLDAAAARRAARFHVSDPAPFRDALIAATALEQGLAVVTRNQKDFTRFPGLRVLDPWAGG
ncbi:MAG: PIN domain-containing protein [Sporichthyaceae bacterium]